jgi:hypothetical protein
LQNTLQNRQGEHGLSAGGGGETRGFGDDPLGIVVAMS